MFSPARIGALVRGATIPVALLAAGFALRLAAGRGLLWLDEIWSLQNALSLTSPLEAVSVLRHDNNHILNTLLLLLIGPNQPLLLYRLPAIFAGTAAVAVAGWSGTQYGRIGRWTAMTLTASSYLLVHYSSEARGYSWLVLWSLTSYESLRRLLSEWETSASPTHAKPPGNLHGNAGASAVVFSGSTDGRESPRRHTWHWAILFSLSSALGFLAHPTFLHVYVAALCWSVTFVLTRPSTATNAAWLSEPCGQYSTAPRALLRRCARGVLLMPGEALTSPVGRREAARILAASHVLPIATALLLYAVNLRHMTLGGGPDYSLPRLLVQTGSLTLGGSHEGPLAFVACLLFVAGIAAGLMLLRRSDRGQWQFHVLAIGLPVLQSVVARPPFAFVRYYLVSVVFGLMVLSYLLSQWLQTGGWRQKTATVVLALYLLTNGAHCAKLIRIGRGNYLAALEYMVRQSDDAPVRVTSDHHHGVQMLTEFYSPFVHSPRRVVYEKDVDWNRDPPPWLILHREPGGRAEPPASEWRVARRLYRFEREFDCSPLSGWKWRLYHLVVTPEPTRPSNRPESGT